MHNRNGTNIIIYYDKHTKVFYNCIIMGIKNFFKFIEKYAPESIKQKKIKDYENTSIGIDFNLMIYKLIYSIRKNGYDITNNDKIVTHIHALLLKLISFKEHKINAIFVFDGKFPVIKSKVISDRKKMWQKLNEKYKSAKTEEQKKKYFYVKSDVTDKELEDCKQLILIFGYNVIVAPEEADAQLAHMSKNNIINYIASDDTDILLFGGERLLKNFSVSKSKWIIEIDLEILKNALDFSQNDLIKLGVLLGSDYCDNSPISINKAYKVLKGMEISDIENQCNGAIKYFKKPLVSNIKKLPSENKINIDKLYEFLKDHDYTDEYIEKLLFKIY